jgi:alanine racemase
MIDVTGADAIQSGDEVVLWGEQGSEYVSKVELEELSDGNTNTYRMATRIPLYTPRLLV